MVHMGLPWRFAELPTKLRIKTHRTRRHLTAARAQKACPWSSPPSSFSSTTSKPGMGQTCLQRGGFTFHDYWLEEAVKVAQTGKQEK